MALPPLNFFKPQKFPEPPRALAHYRTLSSREKDIFHKDNPEYFKGGNEGGDYLDECEGIMAQNTRNLVALLEYRDLGDKSAELARAIAEYRDQPLFPPIATPKYWAEVGAMKPITKMGGSYD